MIFRNGPVVGWNGVISVVIVVDDGAIRVSQTAELIDAFTNGRHSYRVAGTDESEAD